MAAVGKVRPLHQDDIPAIAALQWKYLHGRCLQHPCELERYLESLFFANPFVEKDLPSLVYENVEGSPVGFLGVVPRRMSLCGRPVRVVFGSGLVVHPRSRPALAGLQLLSEFLNRNQDLAMTDTASHLSRQIWTAVGGSAVPLYGLQWSRPLRPTLYGSYGVAKVGKSALINTLARACRPLCGIADRVATALAGDPWRDKESTLREEELDVPTLLEAYSSSTRTYSLRPEYNRDSLEWLLKFTSRMKAHGDLRKVALRNGTGKLAGWYIYYAKSGGIGEVVQAEAINSSVSTLLDHLFQDAFSHGAIGLHGRLDIRFAQEFSEKGCFFWGGIPLLVHSRNFDLVRLLQNGDTFLTRLDGEWCLRYGEDSVLPDPPAVALKTSRVTIGPLIHQIIRLRKAQGLPTP